MTGGWVLGGYRDESATSRLGKMIATRHHARDAAYILAGSAAQDLAFRLAQVALPLVVLHQTESMALMGLVAGAEGLPVLVSPWWARSARQWVSTGRSLTAVAVLDAVALSVVPAAAALHQLSATVLVAAGLLLGVGETLGGPGRAALLADVGDRLGPDRAVALLTAQDLLRRAGMIVGPGLGAIGVAAGWELELLWLEAGTVLVSGVLAWPVQGEISSPAAEGSAAPEIRCALAGRPEVLAGWVMRGTSCLTWFAFSLGLAVLGVEQGRPGVLYACGITAYGAGALLGTVFAVRVIAHLPVLRVATSAWGVAGLAWVVMAGWPTLLGIAATSALTGGFVVVGIAAVNASITRTSTGATRRALLSGQTVVVSASSSAGMLIGGLVLATLGVRPTLVAAGVVVATTALAARTVARRLIGPTPQTDRAEVGSTAPSTS